MQVTNKLYIKLADFIKLYLLYHQVCELYHADLLQLDICRPVCKLMKQLISSLHAVRKLQQVCSQLVTDLLHQCNTNASWYRLGDNRLAATCAFLAVYIQMIYYTLSFSRRNFKRQRKLAKYDLRWYVLKLWPPLKLRWIRLNPVAKEQVLIKCSLVYLPLPVLSISLSCYTQAWKNYFCDHCNRTKNFCHRSGMRLSRQEWKQNINAI